MICLLFLILKFTYNIINLKLREYNENCRISSLQIVTPSALSLISVSSSHFSLGLPFLLRPLSFPFELECRFKTHLPETTQAGSYCNL